MLQTALHNNLSGIVKMQEEDMRKAKPDKKRRSNASNMSDRSADSAKDRQGAGKSPALQGSSHGEIIPAPVEAGVEHSTTAPAAEEYSPEPIPSDPSPRKGNAAEEPMVGFIWWLATNKLAEPTGDPKVWVVTADVYDKLDGLQRQYESIQNAKSRAGTQIRERQTGKTGMENPAIPDQPSTVGSDQGLREQIEQEKIRTSVRQVFGESMRFRQIEVGVEVETLSLQLGKQRLVRQRRRPGLSIARRSAQSLDRSIRQELATRRKSNAKNAYKALVNAKKRKRSGP
jgi:hypothetical protein